MLATCRVLVFARSCLLIDLPLCCPCCPLSFCVTRCVLCREPAQLTSISQLNLFSLVQQQRTLLALAEEQIHVVELEQRLVQAETARIMRDHKLALFQAKEDDLVSELAERDARLDHLEAELREANTSRKHQRVADDRAAREEAESLKAENKAMESKVERLESSVKALRDKENEARVELEGWLREEKGKESGVSGTESN
jgi:chromosome segregation ATPase